MPCAEVWRTQPGACCEDFASATMRTRGIHIDLRVEFTNLHAGRLWPGEAAYTLRATRLLRAEAYATEHAPGCGDGPFAGVCRERGAGAAAQHRVARTVSGVRIAIHPTGALGHISAMAFLRFLVGLSAACTLAWVSAQRIGLALRARELTTSVLLRT